MRNVGNQLVLLLLGLVLPLQDGPAQPDFAGVIQQIAQKFTVIASQVLSAIDTAAISISRGAYFSLILLGILLYSTHLARRLGKDFIRGGVALAVLVEVVLPLIHP